MNEEPLKLNVVKISSNCICEEKHKCEYLCGWKAEVNSMNVEGFVWIWWCIICVQKELKFNESVRLQISILFSLICPVRCFHLSSSEGIENPSIFASEHVYRANKSNFYDLYFTTGEYWKAKIKADTSCWRLIFVCGT